MRSVDCMKNYNENWIKRRARAIKKERLIPHHEALEEASKEAGFQNWRHFLSSETLPISLKTIRRGTMVRLKERSRLNWSAIAIEQNEDFVTCYTEWGKLRCMRWEISVCRDQSQASSFRPMRIVLPYGKWTCVDGTEVLFNRDYRPIWKKQSNGTVVAANPNEWVTFKDQEFLFGDHNPPREDRNSHRICINLLRNWGVEHDAPEMLKLFRQAVATGDLSLLDKPSIYRN